MPTERRILLAPLILEEFHAQLRLFGLLIRIPPLALHIGGFPGMTNCEETPRQTPRPAGGIMYFIWKQPRIPQEELQKPTATCLS